MAASNTVKESLQRLQIPLLRSILVEPPVLCLKPVRAVRIHGRDNERPVEAASFLKIHSGTPFVKRYRLKEFLVRICMIG